MPPEKLRSLMRGFVYRIRMTIDRAQNRGWIRNESSVFSNHVEGTALIPNVITFQVGFNPIISEVIGSEGSSCLERYQTPHPNLREYTHYID
jgi:hypothetical protein